MAMQVKYVIEVIEVDRKIREGGATPTSNQQPQSQDPTSQRDRRIMRRARAWGREGRDRIGEDGGEATKRKKPQKSYRRDEENGRDLGGWRKKHRQESIGSVDAPTQKT